VQQTHSVSVINGQSLELMLYSKINAVMRFMQNT